MEVEIWLAVLLFCSALLTKILHRLKNRLSIWLTDILISDYSEVKQLESLIELVKNEMDSTEDLEKRISLFNKKTKKQNELTKLSKLSNSRIQRTRKICLTILFIIIEASRLIIIFMNRTTPVFILPTDMLWPLTRIFAFPTGVTGAISPVVWGLICRQLMEQVISILNFRK